jgi:glucose dehydrogenase
MRLCVIFLTIAFLGGAATDSTGDWPTYGHDPGGQRFSPLSAINRKNVAWNYRTGDAYQPKYDKPTAFEATPLYINRTLYDSKVERDKGYGDFANRGVSAATGKPCKDCGDNGVVNLRRGLRIAPKDFSDYEETSPPAVIGDTVIVGSGVADNVATDQPSGEVRGFDATSGRLKERAVPKTDVAGEVSSPTQPFPVAPRPLAPQTLGADDIWGIDEADRAACRAEIGKLRSEGIFTPPSVRGTLIVPGNIGGMAWGGAAYDRDHDVLIIPTNRLVAEVRLIPRGSFEQQRSEGRSIGGDWAFAARGTRHAGRRAFGRLRSCVFTAIVADLTGECGNAEVGFCVGGCHFVMVGMIVNRSRTLCLQPNEIALQPRRH